jgi:hypothetical protein
VPRPAAGAARWRPGRERPSPRYGRSGSRPAAPRLGSGTTRSTISSTDASTRSTGRTGSSARAFRGLSLVFALSFLNLVGVIVTAAALGGVEPWTRWQFVGLFGLLEAASGLANVISPNLWRLPITELQTSDGTEVKLAGTALFLPHWGGLARTAAGVVFLGAAAWQESGVGTVTLGLVPLVLALASTILAISAILARVGVARPDLDVLQFVVRWGLRERELRPISVGASVFQFLLSIATIPAAKLLPPSVLYQPELGPSASALLATLATAAALLVLVYGLWSNRIEWKAPREQQLDAEQES